MQVAWVVAAQSIAMFALQILLGYVFDHLRRKRLLLAVGAVGLAAAAVLMGIAEHPTITYVVGVQILFGGALSLLALAIPAITVAETEEDELGNRMARNEVCAKIGNLSALATAGLLSRFIPLRQVFFMIPLLAVPTLGLVAWHGAGPKGRAKKSKPRRSFRVKPSRGGLVLCVVVFLLMLGETGAITIFQQAFGKANPGAASYVAWAMGFGQACVTVGVLALTRVDGSKGLVLTLSGALGLVIGRLFVMATGPTIVALTLGQVMDGMITAVLTTVPARLLARLDPKDFNVISGIQGAAGTLGAMLSTLLTGYLMDRFGYPRSLVFYVPAAGLGLAAVLFFARSLAKDRR